MTIAAGILTKEGVLLCSDTQMEQLSMNTHGPKMGRFTCPGGRIAFALAGNVPFGLAAIQKCARKLDAVSPLEVLDEADRILAEEYEQVVFRHPYYSTNPAAVQYWFLIALYSNGSGVKLFATHENTIHEVSKVQNHECLGIGQELAEYILGSNRLRLANPQEEITEREASALATYMLSKIKDHVLGCGGMSQFLAIRHDGSIEGLNGFPLDQLARGSRYFDYMVRNTFLACTDDELTDEEFEQTLEQLSANARTLRAEWKRNIKDSPFPFAAMFHEDMSQK